MICVATRIAMSVTVVATFLRSEYQTILLSLMKTGKLTQSMHNKLRQTHMKTWVSVTSNGTRKLSEPSLSRFRVYLSKYYFSQFHEIAVNIYYGVDYFK